MKFEKPYSATVLPRRQAVKPFFSVCRAAEGCTLLNIHTGIGVP